MDGVLCWHYVDGFAFPNRICAVGVLHMSNVVISILCLTSVYTSHTIECCCGDARAVRQPFGFFECMVGSLSYPNAYFNAIYCSIRREQGICLASFSLVALFQLPFQIPVCPVLHVNTIPFSFSLRLAKGSLLCGLSLVA